MGQYVVAIIYTFEIFEKVELSAISFLDIVSRPNNVDVVLHMGPFFFFFFCLSLNI